MFLKPFKAVTFKIAIVPVEFYQIIKHSFTADLHRIK